MPRHGGSTRRPTKTTRRNRWRYFMENFGIEPPPRKGSSMRDPDKTLRMD